MAADPKLASSPKAEHPNAQSNQLQRAGHRTRKQTEAVQNTMSSSNASDHIGLLVRMHLNDLKRCRGLGEIRTVFTRCEATRSNASQG